MMIDKFYSSVSHLEPCNIFQNAYITTTTPDAERGRGSPAPKQAPSPTDDTTAPPTFPEHLLTCTLSAFPSLHADLEFRLVRLEEGILLLRDRFRIHTEHSFAPVVSSNQFNYNYSTDATLNIMCTIRSWEYLREDTAGWSVEAEEG
jgi:hypothetical protein